MITTDEISAAFKSVADAFESLGIPYYLGGSVVSSIYGVGRSTLDVDVVSNLSPPHISPLVSLLEEKYYINADSIDAAIKNSSSFNLIHLPTSIKVDVFIQKQRAYDLAAVARIRKDTISDDADAPAFFLASAEDIILAKLEWFHKGGRTSERQWNDILGVLRVQGQNLEREYLCKWAEALEVSGLLEKALSET